MRNPFARLAKCDTARPSLRERAAALKASAARVIRRKPMNAASASAESNPDAALLAAADRARPFIAWEEGLEAEFQRLEALTDSLAVERFGPRPDPRNDWEGMQAYDEKREGLRHETGRQVAWAAMANNSNAIWDLLGPFMDQPAKTLEGAAAKCALAVSDLWDSDDAVREVAALFYGTPVEPSASIGPFKSSTPINGFSDMSVTDLRRAYVAFKLASEILMLAGEAIPGEGIGRGFIEVEAERLVSLHHGIADELEGRRIPNRKEAGQRIDVLVARALACGNFEEVGDFAAEAVAKDL